MLKTLLGQVKEYKKDSILSPVYVSIESILEVLIPFLMAYLVDQGIEKGNMSAIFLRIYDVDSFFCFFMGRS